MGCGATKAAPEAANNPGAPPAAKEQTNTAGEKQKTKTDRRSEILVLFDIDGTLTEPRKVITSEMKSFLKELRKRVSIGVVGGSDFVKQKEQLGEDALEYFDFNFPENGVVAFKKGVPQESQSIAAFLGEEKLKEFINFCLRALADIDLPKKRGTFLEYRTGMINLSPIGRNCTQEERMEYYEYDQKHEVRKKLIQKLKEHFVDLGLQYSIGGQISIDVFPKGWDKTYCLRHVASENFSEIHFFGDKTMEGGNDYEIYRHELVTGHAIQSPQDTMSQCKKLFFE